MKNIAHITTISLAVGLGFWLSSCDENMVKYTFPHKPHIEDEISCDACHEPDGKNLTMPAFDACLTCHEEEPDKFSTCNQCHEPQNIKMEAESIVSHKALFAAYLSSEWDDVEMNHAPYVDMGEESCLTCHENIKITMHSTVENLPAMNVTMAFHDANELSNDCQACHQNLNTQTPPSSHNASWMKQHGFAREFQEMDSCLLCHEQNTCNSCHETQKPQSHTNQFRRHTHGLQAAFDRDSCLTCHRNDECESCHIAAANPVPATEFHTPGAQCTACHVPQGAPRPASRFLKPMPHRMMMGMTSQKCLSCHLL